MLRILLIDDKENDIAYFLKTLKSIKHLNTEVQQANSVKSSSLILKSFQADIVISELELKEESQKKIIGFLNEISTKYPVILITNQKADKLIKQSKNIGISDFIPRKSLTPDLLEKTLHFTMERLAFQKERKRMQFEITEKNKHIHRTSRQIEELAYTLSHDLRGPVGSILGLADLINSTSNNLEEIKQFSQLIHSSANDLNELLKQLLDVLLANKNIYDKAELLDIKQEITKVMEKLRVVYPSLVYNIKVNCKKISEILYSQNAFEFILYNLLSNALKFRSNRRALEIKVETDLVNKNLVCIAVKDNGVGMDMNMVKPRIFKIFKRFHKNVEGRGIGLYAVKAMLDELEGYIEVDSELNIGSEFRIFLKPLANNVFPVSTEYNPV
ncbi:ATP-binding response regulator [Chondrinema litorale]|uniref:ATP-binding response regulator n=1 Tax=Chondrinema litorale TaxID=2994555 RepID=UPI0025443134|nr:hybrid sensor histidine kinase/response regulator [Chondrinema litorale]UZR93436.1 ATP-binding protein [Chondrinema litorale]